MFSWNAQKAVRNDKKHGVPFEEATTIFADPNALDWDDPEHSQTEPRFKRIGISIEGRVLIVVYTVRRTKNGKETIRRVDTRSSAEITATETSFRSRLTPPQ